MTDSMPSVRCRVMDHVERCMNTLVGFRVGGRVWDRVGSRVWNRVMESLDD